MLQDVSLRFLEKLVNPMRYLETANHHLRMGWAAVVKSIEKPKTETKFVLSHFQ